MYPLSKLNLFIAEGKDHINDVIRSLGSGGAGGAAAPPGKKIRGCATPPWKFS